MQGRLNWGGATGSGNQRGFGGAGTQWEQERGEGRSYLIRTTLHRISMFGIGILPYLFRLYYGNWVLLSPLSRNTPLVTPHIFVQPSKLDGFNDYISAQEALHKVPKKVMANNTCNETTWRACNDTGLMGLCFGHNSVIYMANIHGSGDTQAHPLTIIKHILSHINEERPVGILYDIGCLLDKYMNLVRTLTLHYDCRPSSWFVFSFVCWRNIFPNSSGWGLSDGESLKQLCSVFSPQVSPLKYAKRSNRVLALSHSQAFNKLGLHCKSFYLSQPIIDHYFCVNTAIDKVFRTWVSLSFCMILSIDIQAGPGPWDTEGKTVMDLVQLRNPNSKRGANYTVDFFRAQSSQVRAAIEQEDADAQKKKLAQFLVDEEILKSYRGITRNFVELNKRNSGCRRCYGRQNRIFTNSRLKYGRRGSRLRLFSRVTSWGHGSRNESWLQSSAVRPRWRRQLNYLMIGDKRICKRPIPANLRCRKIKT
ncbi:hypothetical protein VP01_1820g1 [Puccinia sorghi]|uniref:Uncharacterized protein n=1 Tax=Puccinia sorghi TaxID=27349 RepID=A0A0L6VE15_9BASI|nr:hypothetical protein VP01_1820g1 [Puccinia sorghi]